MKPAKSVDEYITTASKDVQPKLRALRAAIKDGAPDSVESISYGMPFYGYKGEARFNARLVYFGLLKSKIALYMRPQDIQGHRETDQYKSTKSALQFPLDQSIPVSLVKKLVREAIKRHYALKQNSPAETRKPRRAKSRG